MFRTGWKHQGIEETDPNLPPCGRLPGVYCEPPAYAGPVNRVGIAIVMNVQIAPVQTPPARGQTTWKRTGAAILRTYVIGGVALALVLGGYWYFTHDSGAPSAKRERWPRR